MTYDIAFAGAGSAAEMHVDALDDVPAGRAVAVSSRRVESAESFADRHGLGAGAAYDDVAAMLDGADPDVLVVTTPSAMHLAPTRAAAERGVHVLCEKPLEATTDRVDEMIAVCEDAGVRLGGVFQNRYNGVFGAVHEAAASGRFGSLATASGYVPWWRSDDYYRTGGWQATAATSGGGAVMNQAVHTIDAVQWLAGATMELGPEENPVAEVFAYADTRGHDDDLIEIEDAAVAVLRFRDGSLGQLLGSTASYPGSATRVQLTGRDGSAEVADATLESWRFREERDGDAETRERFAGETAGDGAADPESVDTSNHARNVAAYLEWLDGDDDFALTASEARKAVAVVEAVYDSAERSEPVRPA